MTTTIWTCPNGECGADLEGSMLDEGMWCPNEEMEIPNSWLED